MLDLLLCSRKKHYHAPSSMSLCSCILLLCLLKVTFDLDNDVEVL